MRRDLAEEALSAQRGRNEGIDAFKFLMVMLVIVLHLLPESKIGPSGVPNWAMFAEQLCRCAVPYFFIVTGYYFSANRGFVQNATKAIREIGPIYLFWSAIYTAVGLMHPGGWSFRAIWLIEGGYGFHLWFLPALIIGRVVVAAMTATGGKRLAYLVAVLLLLVGPVLLNYHSLIGIARYSAHFADVNRQLAVPAYICIGMALRHAPNLNWKYAIGLCILTGLGELVERYLLEVYNVGGAKLSSDGVLFTYAFGASVFLLARSLHGSAIATWLADEGKLSLAIYVCHLLFVWLLQAVTPMMPWRTLTMVIGTTFLSVVTAKILIRMPVLQNFCVPPSERGRSPAKVQAAS